MRRSWRSWLVFLAAWVLGLSGGALALGQEEEDPFRPGLIGRYSTPTGASWERIDREIAFAWGENPPDRRLERGPYRVVWRGRLRSQATGEYQLHAHFSGRLRVSLNGQTLIDAVSQRPEWRSSRPVELEFDEHRLEVVFDKTLGSAQVALFWSGPQFALEPLTGLHLWHEKEKSPSPAFARGETLVRALRCAACHEIPGEPSPLPGPSLEHVTDSLHPAWVTHWLTTQPPPTVDSPQSEAENESQARRMPYLALQDGEANAMTAWLVSQSRPLGPAPPAANPRPPAATKSDKKKKKGDPEPPAKSPPEAGRELALTVGCLACHRLGDLGNTSWFDGGDLSSIAAKRPERFLRGWLEAPARFNPQHRMPVFDLSADERNQLAAFLGTQGSAPGATAIDRNRVALGREAIQRHRCAACHQLPGETVSVAKTKLTRDSRWERSCAGEQALPGQPQYSLTAADRAAIRTFVSQVNHDANAGARLLAEKNCAACHQYDGSAGLAAILPRVAERHPALAPLVPAMTPPALLGVGDKLAPAALRGALLREGPPHRPYLAVRMPRFRWNGSEADDLAAHLVTRDRIPDGAPRASVAETAPVTPALLDAVGSRLVTADGFGCTSCHQIGAVLPEKAPLNARGPDLSLVGQRIRREWFDRWVRNPARIVPRMEMPSVQVAVRGILNDHLDHQLAAVWDVLNKPGFQPPLPNPVRVARHSGVQLDDPAIVITDVLRSPAGTLLKPLLVGLANRNQVLFDLETARWVGWSAGDAARQRTEGKSWYWEAAGNEIQRADLTMPELAEIRGNDRVLPRVVGQFTTELDELEHLQSGVRFRYRLRMGESTAWWNVVQTVTPMVSSPRTGIVRAVEVTGVTPGTTVELAVVGPSRSRQAIPAANGRSLDFSTPLPHTITVQQPASVFTNEGRLRATADDQGRVLFTLEYATAIPVDQFVVPAPPVANPQPEVLTVVPGFTTARLPLPEEVMPTALAWRPGGPLLIASLKGQVWQARDTNGDGWEDSAQVFSDELAAPYGLHATADYVDVINKYALLRLFDENGDGRAERTVTVASGWGHTVDYHDWAVGLPRDEAGNYYVALPCQQDQRSTAAAVWRGALLQLVPRTPTPDDPRLFTPQVYSRGHRFPMGLARRRDGELFVTDNQGNYNPFNELNHVRRGSHFGFINALEKDQPERPPLVPPAVNLPHPWVRSVNGICFLETPPALRGQGRTASFGPFEGHLVGCEYDTRRLIRVSLQTVAGQIQGAAYPLSYDQPPSGPPLLGPVVCQVSPRGELYVGGLRDSGWGGANNIGEVVSLRFTPEQLPCGIAEMRVVPGGFELEFTTPVDSAKAADPAQYALASYTRESTSAYGGPDLHARTEKITAVEVAADARRVVLRVSDLRPGFVYELHVKRLSREGESFFPAEAHYSLWRVPSAP